MIDAKLANTRQLTREEEIELKEHSVRRIKDFLVRVEVWRRESLQRLLLRRV